MTANNPFCLSFGREPDRFVERTDAYEAITNTFNSISPSTNSYLIMGVRGSGKTVLMATIANEYRNYKDWVVISLNPMRDLLQMLASGLYEDAKLKKHFIEASLNLSKFGIGFDVKENPPVSDIQIALDKMVNIVKNQGKKILITIDDITKGDNVISFASAYQDLISKNYPVYLIMTGLYENIYSLQTDKRCSFLLRAERIMLKPLNLLGMKNQYKQTFNCSDDEAMRMAAFTKGYSYAFQALGYIIWDKDCSLEEAIEKFDERMSEYCYDKIWSDLSEAEKKIVTLLAQNGKMKAKDIIEYTGCNAKTYSVQRDRLIKKGIIDGSEYGTVSFALPRFDEFVKAYTYVL